MTVITRRGAAGIPADKGEWGHRCNTQRSRPHMVLVTPGAAPDLLSGRRLVPTMASQPETPSNTPRRSDVTSVYRYYDRYGTLIYVGITGQGPGRNTQHSRNAEWWRFVAQQEVEHLPTRAVAMQRERALIIQHRPPFNIQHNPDAGMWRAAYFEVMLNDVTPDTPFAVAAGLNKRLPLVAFSPDEPGVLRTEPWHMLLARCVDPLIPVPVLDENGMRLTGVVNAQMHGPVLVIKLGKPLPVLSGEAVFKFHSNKNPPVVHLRRIVVKVDRFAMVGGR